MAPAARRGKREQAPMDEEAEHNMEEYVGKLQTWTSSIPVLSGSGRRQAWYGASSCAAVRGELWRGASSRPRRHGVGEVRRGACELWRAVGARLAISGTRRHRAGEVQRAAAQGRRGPQLLHFLPNPLELLFGPFSSRFSLHGRSKERQREAGRAPWMGRSLMWTSTQGRWRPARARAAAAVGAAGQAPPPPSPPPPPPLLCQAGMGDSTCERRMASLVWKLFLNYIQRTQADGNPIEQAKKLKKLISFKTNVCLFILREELNDDTDIMQLEQPTNDVYIGIHAVSCPSVIFSPPVILVITIIHAYVHCIQHPCCRDHVHHRPI